MLSLCEQIQGCVLGYTQSDEITLVLVDYQRLESMAWFDNQVQKICSVAASIATQAFEKALEEQIENCYIEVDWARENGWEEEVIKEIKKARKLEEKKYKANFDARAFNLPISEVINNLIWRQQDCIRNSINLLAQSLYSHKELQGISCKDLQNKMLIEKNINWNNEKTGFKYGVSAIRDKNGKWFIDELTPIFTEDRDYINRLIYPESDD